MTPCSEQWVRGLGFCWETCLGEVWGLQQAPWDTAHTGGAEWRTQAPVLGGAQPASLHGHGRGRAKPPELHLQTRPLKSRFGCPTAKLPNRHLFTSQHLHCHSPYPPLHVPLCRGLLLGSLPFPLPCHPSSPWQPGKL